jgi:hypothetical protein
VFWGTLGLLLVLMGIGYLGFYFIRDPSVDGNSYHAEMILGVLNGKSLFSLDWMYVRNTYYPKTIEVLFSGFSALTDTLDAGRILKLILIVLSGINVVQFLKSFPLAQSWKNWRWIGVFVFIIVVNPVVMYQFFTLYIDDVLYLLLVNFLMYVWLGNTKIALFVFALMVGAKLSYGFFGVLGLLVVIGSLACVRKVSFLNVVSACYQDLGKTSWVRILVLLMGIWVGLHQYLANAWNFHNPLYGFVGEGKKDIISMFQPPQMQKQSKF